MSIVTMLLKRILKFSIKITKIVKSIMKCEVIVRPGSVSPPPENDALSKIPNLEKWFGCRSYFLDRQYELEGIPPFDVITIPHSDEQQSESSFELGARYWQMSETDMYYIRSVKVRTNEIEVVFTRRSPKSFLLVEDNIVRVFGLSEEFIPGGMISQDHMPRFDCFQKFGKFKDKDGKLMPPSHVEKFFNAFLYLLISKTYSANKSVPIVTGRKSIGETRLKRMTNAMLSTWDRYPEFARRYAKNPAPVCIADQRFDADVDPETSHGNLIVKIYLNKLPEDYDDNYDAERVANWLEQGLDPYEELKKECPNIKKPPTFEIFRW